jgi:hypothetical protein
MIVGTDHYDINVREGVGKSLLKLKRYFDGRHSVSEVSQITGIPVNDIETLIGQFAEMGLFHRDTSIGGRIPVEEFLHRIDGACIMWGRQIGFHPLFKLLETGEAEQEVFSGLMLETYHFVKSASRHISTAIAQCSDPGQANLLSRYLSDESDHASLLLKVVCNLGMSVESATNSHPTVGTLSLINMLCQIGRESTLAYLVCTSLLEARRDEADRAREVLKSVCQIYGHNPQAINPLLRHMDCDLESDHIGLLSLALRDREFVDVHDAALAVNHLHDLKHAFDQFHDQILQYYTGVTNYIPRLKVDFFSL